VTAIDYLNNHIHTYVVLLGATITGEWIQSPAPHAGIAVQALVCYVVLCQRRLENVLFRHLERGLTYLVAHAYDDQNPGIHTNVQLEYENTNSTGMKVHKRDWFVCNLIDLVIKRLSKNSRFMTYLEKAHDAGSADHIYVNSLCSRLHLCLQKKKKNISSIKVCRPQVLL
jgi:hypothetical protein